VRGREEEVGQGEEGGEGEMGGREAEVGGVVSLRSHYHYIN